MTSTAPTPPPADDHDPAEPLDRRGPASDTRGPDRDGAGRWRPGHKGHPAQHWTRRGLTKGEKDYVQRFEKLLMRVGKRPGRVAHYRAMQALQARRRLLWTNENAERMSPGLLDKAERAAALLYEIELEAQGGETAVRGGAERSDPLDRPANGTPGGHNRHYTNPADPLLQPEADK